MINEVTKHIQLLLQGKCPETINVENCKKQTERELAQSVNQLTDFIAQIKDFIIPLSKGKLHDIGIQPGNFLGSPFKELHSCLLHLTWQAGHVASGDYKQRVDFMGDFSKAFNSMVVALEDKEEKLNKKIAELEDALVRVDQLEKILPICMHCKKIRKPGAAPEEIDSWEIMESYISRKTATQFSHGLCPECAQKFYGDILNADKTG